MLLTLAVSPEVELIPPCYKEATSCQLQHENLLVQQQWTWLFHGTVWWYRKRAHCCNSLRCSTFSWLKYLLYFFWIKTQVLKFYDFSAILFFISPQAFSESNINFSLHNLLHSQNLVTCWDVLRRRICMRHLVDFWIHRWKMDHLQNNFVAIKWTSSRLQSVTNSILTSMAIKSWYTSLHNW